jgi:hypothetical protein
VVELRVVSDYFVGIWLVGYFLYKVRIFDPNRGQNNEESVVRLGYFLRTSRDIGVPHTIARLEWHMEIEPH